VDVGRRRTGHDQISECLEEAVTVIALQVDTGINAQVAGPVKTASPQPSGKAHSAWLSSICALDEHIENML
jgi:hypothetical protein